MKRRPLTAEEVLAKKRSGFLVVRSIGQPEHRWKPQIKTALREVDKSRDLWGVKVAVFDCKTKGQVYLFCSLGAS